MAISPVPRAALVPEPLRYLQMTTFAGKRKGIEIQLEPLLSFQPLQGLQLASARCGEENERNKSEAKTKKKKRL